MDSLQIILIIMGATAATYLSTPAIMSFAEKIGAVDKPGIRKVHKTNMPRLGGLAIYMVFTVVLVAFFPISDFLKGLLLGSTIIVFVGAVDDCKGIAPKFKLLGQITAALVVVYFGTTVQFVTSPFDGIILLGILAVPVTLLWIVGITNAVNLIDGLDGLAAGISAIAAVTIGIIAFLEGQYEVAVTSLVLAGAVLGFLKYNFYPARIFMGDTGSMFLGFVLAILAIQGLTKSATVISLFIPVVIFGVPILDTFFAVMRRFANGNPIFQADKEHVHHRLLDLGFSHKQTVLLIYGISIILGLSAILLTVITTEKGILMLIALSTIAFYAASRLGVTKIHSEVKTLSSKDYTDLS